MIQECHIKNVFFTENGSHKEVAVILSGDVLQCDIERLSRDPRCVLEGIDDEWSCICENTSMYEALSKIIKVNVRMEERCLFDIADMGMHAERSIVVNRQRISMRNGKPTKDLAIAFAEVLLAISEDGPDMEHIAEKLDQDILQLLVENRKNARLLSQNMWRHRLLMFYANRLKGVSALSGIAWSEMRYRY